jgi:hypothetical protein
VSDATPWWRGAVIYQIISAASATPTATARRFRGAESKLDYIARSASMRSGCRRSIRRPIAIGAMTFRTMKTSIPITARCRFRAAARGGACARAEGDDRRGAGAHLRRACVVRRSLKAATRPTGMCGRRRAKTARRPTTGCRRSAGGLGLSAGAAAILPPQIPAPAAQAQLAQSGGAEGRRWRCSICGWRAASTASGSMSPTPISTMRRCRQSRRAGRQAHAANWAHAPNLQYHFHDSNLVENIEALDEIRARSIGIPTAS